MRHFLWITGGLAGLLAPGLAEAETSAASGDSPEAAALTYEEDVRPILKAHCFHCHGEQDEKQAGLDLRLRRFLVEGGKSGTAVVPGEPEESLLFQRIRRGEMPPEDNPKLSDTQVETIRAWIAAGAQTAGPEPDSLGPGPLITEAARRHWSFQPIRRPEVPEVDGADRVRTPIDTFVLAKLEANDLSFSPDADRRTFLRRACFDLLGLPPTPEQVERFLADDSPGVPARLVDRLLASPHYGERWGRHWLDAAGYADSEGYTNEDPVREWAYKYRDYVIRSFNGDKPFDRFIREQLAGDEMVEPPYENLEPDELEKLVATGFLRTAPDGTVSGGVDADVARNDVIAETIKIVSTSLLGLTVGCAQCHNHRYDPIPQVDYYRMRAIFDPAYNWKNWRKPRQRLISLYTDADREKAAEIEAEAQKIEERRKEKREEFIQRVFEEQLEEVPEEDREAVREARDTPKKDRTAEQEKLLKRYPDTNVTAGSLYLYDREAADKLKALKKQADEIREKKPKEEFVRALTEVPGRIPESHLFSRGDHEQPKEEVTPAGLTVLHAEEGDDPVPSDDPALPTTGRRLAYARHLTSGRHPLVARVIVNRVWMHHFGEGLVRTPGDFGALGEEPTHPALLDWLASEFMENGWSLKHLHRLIMTSTVYRQQLLTDPQKQRRDPNNRLLSGMNLRRLEAEAIRDAVLSLSGRLNREPFGPAVPVMADQVGQFVIGIENLNAGRPGDVISMHGREFRRSVYVQSRRSRPLAVLDSFDRPAMDPNCVERPTSTVAPQALMLMNNGFFVEQSVYFAERVRGEVGEDREAQVRRVWELVYTRPPTEQELQQAVGLLTDQTESLEGRELVFQDPDGNEKKVADAELLALASFCQTLMSSNEFLYVE